jgi:ubiquinone biosynthesis UbiH/UbiF/VisC/COQ6 family hydroxylase
VNFDLIVVGGGPVGLGMACAAPGLSIALVSHERAAAAPASPAVPDARVYALSPGNVAFLREIGAWGELEPRATPVYAMRVFGDRIGSRIEFDAYRAGVGELAWTVEDGMLQAAMLGALQRRDGVQILAPAECESLAADARRTRLRLRDGRELTASLAIGADGANSFVRTQAGIDSTVADYGQAAVVANFGCEKAHGNIAYQWFQGGPVLALLPLQGRRVSMIWSLPAEEAARIGALPEHALCATVAQAVHGQLGELALVTPPRSYPLRRVSARRLVAHRVALVGDAAHVIHPLAGQGLNLGLQDVRELAATLARRAPVRDPGDALLLRAYERKRAEPILAMDFMVDGLYRLFGAQSRAAAHLRNGGMNLSDRIPVLKNILIRRAMG